MCINYWYVFFSKQKTAYEMRISDWSSDVCSSDLTRRQRVARRRSFRREECGERSGHGFRARRKALESRQRGDKGHRHHRRQPQVRSDRTPPPSAHRSVATHGTAPRSVEIGTRHAGESKGRGLTKSRRGRSAMHGNRLNRARYGAALIAVLRRAARLVVLDPAGATPVPFVVFAALAPLGVAP